MSFFVSENIKNLIDEKTFINQEKVFTNEIESYLLDKKLNKIYKIDSFKKLKFKKNELNEISCNLPIDLLRFFLNDVIIINVQIDSEIYSSEIKKIIKVNDNIFEGKFKLSRR